MTKRKAHGLVEHYKLRAYKMLRAWQKRLLHNRPSATFDFSTVGSHEQVIDAGIYDVWLVGSGGGGALLRSSQSGSKAWARGGVGGVLHVRINVPEQTTITVNVASGATSRMGTFSSAGTTASGDNGNATSITGFENVTLIAGGGTGASVQSSSTTATRRTVGVQGTNTASGANVISVLENNVNIITSTQGTSTATSRQATGQANTNWEEDTQKGCGGDVGWVSSTNYILKAGGVGFVRIKTAD